MRPVFEEFFRLAVESEGALKVVDRGSGAIIGSSRYYGLMGREYISIGYTFLARAF